MRRTRAFVFPKGDSANCVDRPTCGLASRSSLKCVLYRGMLGMTQV